jgi:effector-binding domain-containing protein/uncharacterized protein YndB with AHSA1/START domain
MKALKVVGILLAAVVVIFVVMLFVAPTEYHIKRSVTINAPHEMVFEQTAHFSNFTQWSPWSKLDPNMEQTIEGAEGTVGARLSWKGDPDSVGTGHQVITAVSPERVDMDLVFTEPWQDASKVYFEFASSDSVVTVTWGMDAESPMPENAVMLLMGFESMMHESYDAGLASLKERCETMAAKYVKRGYYIREVDKPETNYIGIRKTIKMSAMADFFSKSYGQLGTFVEQKNIAVTGVPAGLYLSWDEETQTSEAVAAFPVAAGTVTRRGIEGFTLGGKALQIVYKGDYEKSQEPHMAMGEYLQENNLELDTYVLEEYIVGPMNSTDPNAYVTNIVYFLK